MTRTIRVEKKLIKKNYKGKVYRGSAWDADPCLHTDVQGDFFRAGLFAGAVTTLVLGIATAALMIFL